MLCAAAFSGPSLARRDVLRADASPYRSPMTPTICVVGTSYVGLSMAVLLAEPCEVRAFDIDESRVEMLRVARARSPTRTSRSASLAVTCG